MSVKTWGERSEGVWKIVIRDNYGPADNYGSIGAIELILHGTKTLPHHMVAGNRNYNEEYNKVHNYGSNYIYEDDGVKNYLFYDYLLY